MEKIFDTVIGFFHKLADLLLVLLTIGILSQVLFKTSSFGLDVIGNILSIVDKLGSSGIVGIIAIVIMAYLLKK